MRTWSTPDAVWPGVPAGVIDENTGVQCFGCNGQLRLRGTDPQRWVEVLCGRPGCPADAIAAGMAQVRAATQTDKAGTP